MKKIIANDLASNNTSTEAIRALFLSFTFAFRLQPSTSKRAQLLLAKSIGATSDKIYLVDSGRTALAMILKGLNLPVSSEVLLQAFSCIVVPNAVLQAGLVPVVCDVNPIDYNIDLTHAEKQITKNTKVLILQHTFGVTCDMQKVIKFCEKHRLIIIEDCAHALGSSYTYQKKNLPVGSLGSAAIYSFGRDKVISTTIGGAIRLNDTVVSIQESYDQLPEMTYLRELKSLAYIWLCVIWVRPFYYIANIGKFLLFSAQKIGIIEPVYTPSEEQFTNKLDQPSRYGPRLASILISQLLHLPKTQSHRKNICTIYQKYIDNSVQPENGFRFLVKTEGFLRPFEEYVKMLRFQEEVLVGTWYTAPFLPNKSSNLSRINYNPTSTPKALQLISGGVLNLPTNRKVSIEDAERIVGVFIR